jgi:hypothetical protein
LGYKAYVTIKGKTTQAGSGVPSPTNIRELVPIGYQANLLQNTGVPKIENGINFTVNEDKSITCRGTSTADTYFYIHRRLSNIVNKTVTLSGRSAAPPGVRLVLQIYDSNGMWARSPINDTSDGDSAFISLADGERANIVLVIPAGVNINCSIYPMLNYGAVAAPYVPYTGTFYGTQITFNGRPMLLPLTAPLWDMDTIESNVLNKSGMPISRETHSNKKFVFDGTEDWIYDTISGVRFSIVISGKKTGISNVICSHFKTLQKFENPTFSNSLRGSTAQGTEQTVVFYPAEAIATDLASWRDYLAAQYAAGTPVTIVYELAEVESYTHDPIQFLVDSPWATIISDENAFIEVSTEPNHPWILPKTDWYAKEDSSEPYEGDYFEAKDYQRIKNNLLCLKDIADTMWPPVPLPSIPDVTVTDYAYSNMINALERSLDALANGTFNPGIDARKTWVDNAPGPKAQDLNRIEKSCLKIYETLNAQQKSLPRLAFTLGGVQF